MGAALANCVSATAWFRCKTSGRIVAHNDSKLPDPIWRLAIFSSLLEFCYRDMRNVNRFASLWLALITFNSAFAGDAAASADVFTPVIASTLSPEAHPIRGTDGAYHVVYELQLTNTKSVPATIQKIDVAAGANGSQIVTSFSDADLVKRLRTLAPQPATDATIEPNGARLFYIELGFKDAAEVPKLLEHRLHLIGAPNPGPAKPAPLD